ncbi:MAG: 4-hydroxythreonine-4-phosphate dehydrogenase PdxA [Planctomycetia bacterium]
MNTSSKLLITMGDVAGVGPEIIAKAWPALNKICRPIVVGDPEWMKKAIFLVNPSWDMETITDPGKASPNSNKISCLKIPTADLSDVAKCKISAKAGQAAHDFLINAIDLTMAGFADGIVTCPLHKEGLHLAGLDYPGHTEILATRTKALEHVMILALPNLAVAHVTLHTALKNVFEELSTERIIARAELLDDLLTRVHQRKPRLAVCALNPHASDGGLFGNEEQTTIEPAVNKCITKGMNIQGPFPADTLFLRASQGEFDGVVAMYHDQGHIALKLLGKRSTVNITAGIPIIRTSVAHGTAYDIAWQGIADEGSLISAAQWAVNLRK